MNDGKTIVVGFGEIGKAVKEAICPDALVYDISMSDRPDAVTPTSVMHICFPYSENFVHDAQAYITIWQPKHVAIWSTLPIGTTRRVSDKACHTPIEGKHPELAKSIRFMPRWVGCNDEDEEWFFREYFADKRLVVRAGKSSDSTEALKLLSTTEYGINLIYADYKKRVADAVGMDYELMKEWNRDYNQLYRNLDMPQFQKFILDPPNGVLGGHCLRENAALLNKQHPDILVERISNMGKPQEKKS